MTIDITVLQSIGFENIENTLDEFRDGNIEETELLEIIISQIEIVKNLRRKYGNNGLIK